MMVRHSPSIGPTANAVIVRVWHPSGCEDAILAVANVCHRIDVVHLVDIDPQLYSPEDGGIRGNLE